MIQRDYRKVFLSVDEASNTLSSWVFFTISICLEIISNRKCRRWDLSSRQLGLQLHPKKVECSPRLCYDGTDMSVLEFIYNCVLCVRVRPSQSYDSIDCTEISLCPDCQKQLQAGFWSCILGIDRKWSFSASLSIFYFSHIRTLWMQKSCRLHHASFRYHHTQSK